MDVAYCKESMCMYDMCACACARVTACVRARVHVRVSGVCVCACALVRVGVRVCSLENLFRVTFMFYFLFDSERSGLFPTDIGC